MDETEKRIYHDQKIKEMGNLKSRSEGEFVLELESFTIPVLTMNKIKETGLHYKIPEGLAFDNNIKKVKTSLKGKTHLK